MQIYQNDHISVLITYLKPLWKRSLLLFVLLLTGIGLRLINPQLLATFIDTAMSTTGHAYAGATVSRLLQLALLFLAVALSTQLFALLETYLAADIGLRATNQPRANLALHCLQLDMSFHNGQTPGALIERIDGDVSELDEASSRLDPATEQRLECAIDRLLMGRTAIIIAHRLTTVKRANQIMILENGQCIEYGQREALATNPDSRFAQLLQIGLEEALV
jgi:ABC-type multidrug transport system fused ATPase/permease subunit